jgi:iron complex outermembrane recepter protein
MKNFSHSFVAATRHAALCSSGLALALGMPAAAFAQAADEAQPAADAAAEEEASGNEIVVTATKREQTLQDVPVAVSVTTAETIERAQIRDLKDLSSIVPSLRVTERQSSANTNFIIRGFGNGANNAGIEPSVGVFVDGVYRSRSAAQIADLPDVQRIEVLRGPQSTLFGKNASAGVISIVTQQPKFNFGGNVEASYGNYNAMVIKGVVTGPLSETVAASFAAGYNKRDGYTSDLNTGNKTNERNRWFVRGQLLFAPDNGLKVRIIGDYGKIDENCCAVISVLTGPVTGILQSLGGKLNNPANRFGDVVYNNFDSNNKIESYGVSGQIDYESGPLNFTSITALRQLKGVSLQDADFTSADLLGRVFEDRRIKTFTQEFRVSANLVDKVNALLGVFYFNENINQTNQVYWGTAARSYFNIQALAASGGALTIPTLETTFGALEGNPAKYTNRFFAVGTGFDEAYRLKNEAISIFGQLDFEIADRLTLTGGVNYTHDKKNWSTNTASNDVFAGINFNAAAYAPFRNQLLFQGALTQQVGAALGLGRSATAAEVGGFAVAQNATYNAIVAGSQAFAAANQNNPAANPLNAFRGAQLFPPYLNVPNVVEPGKISDSNVSFTARLAYDVSDRINAYASLSTGYKGASVNLSRDARPAPSDQAAIIAAGLASNNLTYGSRFAGPEKATVYEAGLKGSWPQGSLNIAVFKQDIRGFQSNIFTGTGFVLANAGKQSTFGFEFEGSWKPVSGLTIGVSATVLDPKYDDFKNSAFGDATGIRPADIPGFIGSFNAQYEHRFNNGNQLILRGDYRYESEVQVVEGLPNFVTTNAAGVRNTQAGLDAAKPYRRKVNEINASLTYAMESGLEVTLWGRNLNNNRYISTIFDSPAQTGSISAYPNQPRTWGGSVRFRF